MALSTFPYLTAAGDLRYRSVDGAGSIIDPDVATVKDSAVLEAANTIASKLPTLGQKAISGSVSVTPATGSAILVTPVSYLGGVSLGSVSAVNAKASPGTLFSFVATNLNTSTRYIQFFNSTTVPTTGSTPSLVYPIFGSNLLIIDTQIWGLAGVTFTAGISWGFSTTPLTFTAGVASDLVMEIRYL